VFQLRVVHSQHAESCAALGAAKQAAAIYFGLHVGSYCADTTITNATASDFCEQTYYPNADKADVYLKLYQRTITLCNTLFDSTLLLK
jgi:sugar (pentulose or hexulose) kinase